MDKSYKPEELFDKTGRLKPELADLPPKGKRRMSANPHANGGLLLRDLRLPDFRDYAVKVTHPAPLRPSPPAIMGKFLRDTMKLNMDSRNFRLFSPDENNSNRWQDVLEVTNRAGWRIAIHTMIIWPRTAASWRCSASTSARGGWKGIC